VSENRFLQSFSALLAGAILVSGTHLLLIASTNYDVRRLEAEMPRATTPAPAVSVPASPKAAEIVVERQASSASATGGSVDPEITASTSSPQHQDGAHFTGDQAPEALPSGSTASAEPSATVQSEPVEEAEVDTPSPVTTIPSAEDEAAAEAPTAAAPAIEPSESPVNDAPTATASVEPANNAQPAPQAAEAEQATASESAAPQIAQTEPVQSEPAQSEPAASSTAPAEATALPTATAEAAALPTAQTEPTATPPAQTEPAADPADTAGRITDTPARACCAANIANDASRADHTSQSQDGALNAQRRGDENGRDHYSRAARITRQARRTERHENRQGRVRCSAEHGGCEASAGRSG
jgi:hypothetical protein